MAKLFSSAHIESVLKKNGFIFVSQKGSHVKYRKIGVERTLTTIVPTNKREIPVGTFRSILRQSQMSATDF